MFRGTLAAVSLLAGTVIMSPVAEPADPPKPPYTTRVTYLQVVNGKVANETADVEAFRRDVDGVAKWQLKGKQIKVQVQPGDRIVDDQGGIWAVNKASITTGRERIICEVTRAAR